jgi:hypothetical protein
LAGETSRAAEIPSSTTWICRHRRGKAESNDVDIVITHPTLTSGSDQVKGLGEALVNQLYERGEYLPPIFCSLASDTTHVFFEFFFGTGLITHVMRMSPYL